MTRAADHPQSGTGEKRRTPTSTAERGKARHSQCRRCLSGSHNSTKRWGVRAQMNQKAPHGGDRPNDPFDRTRSDQAARGRRSLPGGANTSSRDRDVRWGRPMTMEVARTQEANERVVPAELMRSRERDYLKTRTKKRCSQLKPNLNARDPTLQRQGHGQGWALTFEKASGRGLTGRRRPARSCGSCSPIIAEPGLPTNSTSRTFHSAVRS